MKPTREELLAHYAEAHRQVVRFTQYDGFQNLSSASAMTADDDGDCTIRLTTHELNMSEPPVRVWIHETTSKADALRLLRKLTAWIERAGPHINDDLAPEATALERWFQL